MSDSIALACLIKTIGSDLVSSGPFLYASVAFGSCAHLASSDSHARHNGHSHSNRTVVLQDARFPLLPFIRCESPYYWVLPLTRSPKSDPFMRNRAWRPVARDSNNRPLIRQSSWTPPQIFPDVHRSVS